MADAQVSTAELQGLDLFAGQPEADLRDLAAAARRRRLSDREVLATRGERSTAVAWVVSGRVTLSVEHEGRAVLVMTLGPGDMLGWSMLREDPTALTTARASGPTEIIEVPADRLEEALTNCTPTARVLVRRIIGIAASDLDATRMQLLRLGREGVITAG
jgi:CRP-like cAMP-binding protein